MADPAAVGNRGTPFRMDIERGKVREFAVATGATPADDPAYLDAEHPVIEPTFLTTAFFWQNDTADPWPTVALDQQRGLHAEQEFVFFGPPPRAGDRLTGTAEITDVYTKQGRRGGELTFAVMTTDFTDESGRVAARSILTGVETGQPPVEARAGGES